jgi:hypothetical protein
VAVKITVKIEAVMVSESSAIELTYTCTSNLCNCSLCVGIQPKLNNFDIKTSFMEKRSSLDKTL